jgi:hypothetical protein
MLTPKAPGVLHFIGSIYVICCNPALPGRPCQEKINHLIFGGPSKLIFRVEHRSMYDIRIWWWNSYLGFQEVECSQEDV